MDWQLAVIHPVAFGMSEGNFQLAKVVDAAGIEPASLMGSKRTDYRLLGRAD